MSKTKCAKRICDISERAFWSATRAPCGEAMLAEAIRLGGMGEKARA